MSAHHESLDLAMGVNKTGGQLHTYTHRDTHTHTHTHTRTHTHTHTHTQEHMIQEEVRIHLESTLLVVTLQEVEPALHLVHHSNWRLLGHQEHREHSLEHKGSSGQEVWVGKLQKPEEDSWGFLEEGNIRYQLEGEEVVAAPFITCGRYLPYIT